MIRTTRNVLLVLAVAVVVLWLISPAFQGYHIGFNPATDNIALNHIVQWGKCDPSRPTVDGGTC